MSDEERRHLRKEIQFVQTESVWLQKALFALRKADEAREKVAEVREEKPEPYAFSIEGRSVVLEDIEEALDRRVEELMQGLRDMRKELR